MVHFLSGMTHCSVSNVPCSMVICLPLWLTLDKAKLFVGKPREQSEILIPSKEFAIKLHRMPLKYKPKKDLN